MGKASKRGTRMVRALGYREEIVICQYASLELLITSQYCRHIWLESDDKSIEQYFRANNFPYSSYISPPYLISQSRVKWMLRALCKRLSKYATGNNVFALSSFLQLLQSHSIPAMILSSSTSSRPCPGPRCATLAPLRPVPHIPQPMHAEKSKNMCPARALSPASYNNRNRDSIQPILPSLWCLQCLMVPYSKDETDQLPSGLNSSK